jgi:acetyl esterase/lipase
MKTPFPARAARFAFALLLAAVAPTTSSAQEQSAPRQGRAGAALALPQGTRAKYDIPDVEGGGRSQSLDLFIPPGASADKPMPLVIWVHGGGWQQGDKAQPPALGLLRWGYVVASINYRLTDEAIFPAQINDCKAAVRWLRAHAEEYHIDPDHIGAWGASAGGHLVALLGTAGDQKDLEGDGGNAKFSSNVQAVCDLFGPSDLTRVLDDTAANSALPKLLGGPLRQHLDDAKRASPITYATKDDPPFLILHGTKDPLVNVRQSTWLNDALTKAGVESHLEILDGAGHGGPEFATLENRKMVLAFFDKHLKPDAKPREAATKPTK